MPTVSASCKSCTTPCDEASARKLPIAGMPRGKRAFKWMRCLSTRPIRGRHYLQFDDVGAEAYGGEKVTHGTGLTLHPS